MDAKLALAYPPSVRRPILLMAIVCLVAACDSQQTTSPGSTVPVTDSVAIDESATSVPSQLRDFAATKYSLDGVEYLLAVADMPELRAQGLMGVTDLLSLDGMLFVWPDPTETSFWMKDTLIPLDIAYFDHDGHLVGTQTMTPCELDECPSYRAPGPFTYAIEVPAGGFADLSANAVFVFNR